VRRCGLRDLLPEELAGFTVERHQHQLLLGLRTFVTEAAPAASNGCRLSFGRWDDAGWYGSRHENFIAPNHRGGMPASWDFRFPLYVFGIAPMQRCVSARHAVVIRTAPTWPIAGAIGRKDPHEQSEREQERWDAHGFFEMIQRFARVPARYRDRLPGKYLVVCRFRSQTHGMEFSH
jgi:hypothetical protein